MSDLKLALLKLQRHLSHFVPKLKHLILLISVLDKELLNLILNLNKLILRLQDTAHVLHQSLLDLLRHLFSDLKLDLELLVL